MSSKISRRGFLGAGVGATAMGMAGVRPARAAFPERGIVIVVPYSPGGGSDVSARLLARDLEPVIGKPVTVENRAGGGGWVGWGSLAASTPDGYTIGYVNAPSLFAGYLDRSQGSARKENLESFTPLINHVVDYNIWAVRADSKYQTLKELIEDGKKRPNQITLSGGGNGSDDHVAMLSIEASTGAKFNMIHFRGTAEGRTAAMGGHIDIMALNVSEIAEDIRAGKVRALGVMAPERSKFIPNAPTFKEQGLNEVWSVSRGIAGPAKLPKDIEAALITALEKAITLPDHRKKAEALSLDPTPIKGEAYRKFLKDSEQATKKLMKW